MYQTTRAQYTTFVFINILTSGVDSHTKGPMRGHDKARYDPHHTHLLQSSIFPHKRNTYIWSHMGTHGAHNNNTRLYVLGQRLAMGGAVTVCSWQLALWSRRLGGHVEGGLWMVLAVLQTRTLTLHLLVIWSIAMVVAGHARLGRARLGWARLGQARPGRIRPEPKQP